jgi:hypothetical protein
MNEQANIGSPSRSKRQFSPKQPDQAKIAKEHKAFVQDLVAYFKQSAASDSEWQARWHATLDNEKNGDSYLNF